MFRYHHDVALQRGLCERLLIPAVEIDLQTLYNQKKIDVVSNQVIILDDR